MSKNLYDFQTAWEALCLRELDFDNFTKEEKVWFTLQLLIDSIDNGALISFFYNRYAEYFYEAMKALETLGAVGMIELMKEYEKIFGGKVSNDQDERNEIINNFTEETSAKTEELHKLEDSLTRALEERLYDYIVENNLDKI